MDYTRQAFGNRSETGAVNGFSERIERIVVLMETELRFHHPWGIIAGDRRPVDFSGSIGTGRPV